MLILFVTRCEIVPISHIIYTYELVYSLHGMKVNISPSTNPNPSHSYIHSYIHTVTAASIATAGTRLIQRLNLCQVLTLIHRLHTQELVHIRQIH